MSMKTPDDNGGSSAPALLSPEELKEVCSELAKWMGFASSGGSEDNRDWNRVRHILNSHPLEQIARRKSKSLKLR